MSLAQPSINRKQSWPSRFWRMLLGGEEHNAIHPVSAAESVVGGRSENQDRCYYDDERAVYLVVDGVGGHNGGSLASEIAIDTLAQHLRNASSAGQSSEELGQALHDGLEDAQRKMESIAKLQPDYQKMGCTLAAVAIVGDHAFYTHIGDSRIYLIHDGKIQRLTEDETLVQELVSANVIQRSDIPTHRWRHVITNSLSASGVQREPAWDELRLAPGDQLVLTSDGLTDELTDKEIAKEVVAADSPRHCVKSLIRTALQRDASDNVTCVVTKMQPDS